MMPAGHCHNLNDPHTASFTPLLADDSNPSHAIDTVQPCHLLDVPPPVRSLVLDYMDDRTAIRYLSTCRLLHAGYHAYPVKQAMSVETFREATQLDAYLRLRPLLFQLCALTQLLAPCLLIPLFTQGAWHDNLILLLVSCVLSTWAWCYFAWLLLTRRVDCCTRGWWGRWSRRYQMPRVQRLSEPLSDARLLPYLQHLTELTAAYDRLRPFGKKYPLPRSLLTLHIKSNLDLTLRPSTLPPRLTSLSLGAIKNKTLLAGVLPESLTSLHLTYGFDARFRVGVSVFPSKLVKLEIERLMVPLSHIALPDSLIELHIHSLSDLPLPALPSHLQVLDIGGAFNQPLAGVLPSSLRVLRLACRFDQPLTADVFACTPQLKELYLMTHMNHGPVRELTASGLPSSLRVLQLNKHYMLVVRQESDLPSHLRHLVVAAELEAERVASLEHMGHIRGFSVVQRYM